MAQRRRHAHYDASCRVIRELLAYGTCFTQERHPAGGQNRAGFRDGDAGATSNHQLLTKVMLELRKRSAERGLRQAKLLRRAIDAPQLGNPQKIFKLIEVHAQTPDQCRCNVITARPFFEKVEPGPPVFAGSPCRQFGQA